MSQNNIEKNNGFNKSCGDNEPYVFISYRSIDKDIAYQTKNILKQNGINCWMAPESIPAGNNYCKEIPKALKRCSAFIILLSKNAQESVWIPREIDGAINNGKVIIPFKIDNSDILEEFNFQLENCQRIEAYERMSEAYSELVERLQGLLHIDGANANVDKGSLLSNSEKTQSLQEKSFILQNHTDLRIESYRTPEVCSWFDEYIPTGMFEFIDDRIYFEDIDPDNDTYLGFHFEIKISNKATNGISQIYVGFERFATILNNEYRFNFYTPNHWFPLNITEQGTETLTLSFVCRKLIDEDDVLEEVMESFKRDNPALDLNVIVTNGYVDERFEVCGNLNFSDEEKEKTAEELKKSDIIYTITKYNFCERIIDQFKE